ncbi:MAG: hypothetical protein AB8G23_06510 [Myxococcota bacterium]
MSHSEEADFESLSGAVTEVRRLIAHLRKTQAEPEMLRRVESQARALCEELAPFDHSGPYAQRELVIRNALDQSRSSDLPAEYFPYSPVIGQLNPVSPNIRFDFDPKAREMRATHSFDAPYCGPPASVHGGIVSLVFDELLGCLGAMSDIGGFTGTLKVIYRSLTPLHTPIHMHAWIDRQEGVKVFIKGTMHRDGREGEPEEVLCSEAEGIFIRPKVSILADALSKSSAKSE